MSSVLRVVAFVCLVTSFLAVPGGHPRAQSLQQVSAACGSDASPTSSTLVAAGQTATVSYDGATLAIGSTALPATTSIGIAPLNQDELAALDPGMTNVTMGPRCGYRFLPQYMRFQSNIQVTLPYDPSLIPTGQSANDVKTFYFDETSGSWKELDRVSVNTTAHSITSSSDHFTDMINATISAPDMDGAQLGADQNSIQGLQSADPGQGISLIDPPQPNAQGTAQLSYPLDLPQGRQDMQPDLSIDYDSSNGDGWLGMGWDLSAPAVTVDTRWGVPRYDPNTESESYDLEGKELTPLAHRGDLPARDPNTPDKIFHQRVESDFEKIVRHGTSPKNYRWETVDKSGKHFFYGAAQGASAPDPNATLMDGNGNIFMWALTQVVDISGNTINYHYVHVHDPGVAGGSVQGDQLYLKSIDYTGSGDTPGPYTVTFDRDSELPNYSRRPDVVMDARGGFLMVTAALLKRIEVSFNGSPVRRYDLSYRTGPFDKSLLTSITEYGSQGTAFNTHRFDYYNDIQDSSGAYQGFGPSTSWNTGSDGVTAGLAGFGQASALSGALGTSGGGHLYVGFNPEEPEKEGSAGAKVGFNVSSTDGVLDLLDINGDGLPDKVYKQGGSIYFRLNQSGPNGTTVFGPAHQIPSLPSLDKESSIMVSFGAEAYFGVNGLFNHAETFTTGSTYFMDVNNDGLPDLVQDDNVLFNHLSSGSGIPDFTPNSADTRVPIGSGAVDTNGLLETFTDAKTNTDVATEQAQKFPLQDTLRRWTAPYDGSIKITGPVTLAGTSVDGVRVAIQRNTGGWGSSAGDELWSARIQPTSDQQPVTVQPDNVSDVSVHKGDRIYFRVGSVFDGQHDQVTWNPEIQYVGVQPAIDVNGLDAYDYTASQDFTLAGRPGINVQMPFNGTVRLTGALHKSGVTTDDIKLLILKNCKSIYNLQQDCTQLFSQTMAWNQTGDLALPPDLPVAKNDRLTLRVQVDSPIDLRQIQWDPHLFYVSSPDVPVKDSSGNYMVQLHPPYDIDTYPAINLSAPQQSWTAPQSGTLTVAPSVPAGPVAGQITFTVKKQGALLGKESVSVGSTPSTASALKVNVTQGDKLFFDFSVYDPTVAVGLPTPSVGVTFGDPANGTTAVPSAVHSAIALSNAPDKGLFGEPYRGWAYAGYNANDNRETADVQESRLVFDQSQYPNSQSSQSSFGLEQVGAYLYYPDPENEIWHGPSPGTDKGEMWVSGDGMSSSRVGADHISVPQSSAFSGARAVDRISRTTQDAVGGGVSLLSGSFSTGESYGALDYLDMNGDGFPDIVGHSKIQYTNTVGGLDPQSQDISQVDRVRSSDNTAENFGIGGTAAEFKGDAKGEVNTAERDSTEKPSGQAGDATATGAAETPGGQEPNENETKSQAARLGLSAEVDSGDSNLSYDLLDINGDGLPDRVSRDGDHLDVAFNLGYGFAPAERWGDAAIDKGSSKGVVVGAEIGFNGGIYDFAGGANLAADTDTTAQTLADVNGDGLPDEIVNDGGNLSVALNTGNGFAPAVPWNGSLGQGISTSTNTTLGAGAYFTIGIGPLCLEACYIIINPGGDVSQSMARQELTLRDINGDGYVDDLASTNDGTVTVAENQTGRTNLLKSVSRPLGGTIALDYQRDGNTFDQPYSRWVLSKTDLYDGHPGDGTDHQITTYQYSGGVYNPLERDFYGYSSVTEQEINPADSSVYRSTVSTYRNDNYYDSGLLAKQVVQDGAGNKFLETDNTYELRNVDDPSLPLDPTSTMATGFPALVRTDQLFYEGNPTPGKSTFTTYQYDALGNETQIFDAGDPGSADDVQTTLTYTNCPSTYVMGIPTEIDVSSNGTVLRHTEATVPCDVGSPIQVREDLTATTAAVTDFSYYDNGNLKQLTGPLNLHGQRYQLNYEYDPDVATYVSKVTDSFGYSMSTAYTPLFGEPVSVVDDNHNTISYTYDEFGRMTSTTGPFEQGGSTPTIRYEYHPDAAVPWAMTRHIDTFRDPSDPIDLVTFVDGLDRTIQTKQDGTIFTGVASAPQDVMIVSGHQDFDFVGRSINQYYPVTEPLGTPGTFNPAIDAVQPTRTSYDILDRVTRISFPDNTAESESYGFGADRSGATQFETTNVDADGNRTNTFQNVRQLSTGVEKFLVSAGGSQPIWTSYGYDPLSQLTSITDDKNHTSTIAYDAVGRRTSVDNPDTGRTDSVYDPAGNLVATITANLRAEGKQISYDYDFTRLKSITYPDFPGNDVTYTYGPPGAPNNGADRITQVVDEAGTVQRQYDKLGEITQETRTVANLNPGKKPLDSYTTQYVYDTWGRLQTLTYPDGEVLTYKYDSGGLVRQVTGVKLGNTYPYVKRYEYDKFSEPAFVELGNGVQTQYHYRPDNQRLQTLQSTTPDGTQFQNLNYSYDPVGNVVQSANNVPVPPASQMGGPVTQSFNYDSLYRLTGAAGSYQYAPGKTRNYTLALTYDTLGNMLTKDQTDAIVQPSGTSVPQKKTSYDFSYQYNSVHPDAPTHIDTHTFTYDGNGNQTGWTDDRNGTRRTITWDEENRIQTIADNGHKLTYRYDDQGNRIVQRGPQGETVYVNPYFTIRNGEVGTKNIWVGTTLMVSKLMKNPDASDPAPVESSQYYYHADRLGSSNFVTDASGKIFQHVEYFPFGETWVDEHSNTHRTPYLFTGKQFDETTDLYYYGARYYDPRTSVWQSSDPQLVASPDVSVGDPSLLNAYAYAAQNPVLNIDPNGDVTTPVSYFTDPHAAWARDQRANGNVNGRNLATVKYRITNGIGAGTKGHHTLISSGKHSETRLKAWLEANYPGRYEVLWLYTELEPCGSNVHNCRNKVSGWNWSAKGERVFYSIDYPNEEDVSDTEPSGAMRNAARKRKLAQDRRSVGPQNLKRFQSQLKRRKLNGQPLNVVPVFNPPLRPITPRGGNNL